MQKFQSFMEIFNQGNDCQTIEISKNFSISYYHKTDRLVAIKIQELDIYNCPIGLRLSDSGSVYFALFDLSVVLLSFKKEDLHNSVVVVNSTESSIQDLLRTRLLLSSKKLTETTFEVEFHHDISFDFSEIPESLRGFFTTL